MKKLEDLLDKRNSELDEEKRARDARIKELNSKKLIVTLKLVGSTIGTLIGYNLGIVQWDGSLFSGFFMQLLFMGSAIATVVFIIQLLILLAKNVDN